ncbi:Maleate cis-trans isomerase [Brevibacterium iodinum ATCC 49514]|uniref:Maleate cis-trans isomerase n=1 Tax=Brevibacterium iodinum ATCC 49514 TaxID=1255616 RepID=A0A2H1KJI5_9MICO|nr:hypothetical protein [Brevibacterium iodinum]SMX99917.1 Maleate cis-trans isomerase [Brevibacterium iodinum ATCC 49514]SUW11398.1 Maleate cis-trans isomerase [Brevibacterium iodinum]
MIYKNSTQPHRIGLVVIDNDPIPELEIRPTDDGNVSVVASRFLLNRAPGEIYLGEGHQAVVPPEMQEALEQLDRIGVDAVGLCFTSSSVFAPATFDRLFVDAAQRVNDQWIVATAARSIVDALASVGSTRPFLVAPPWFSNETIHAVTDYLGHHGISYSGWHRYQLGPEWADIRQQDLFDHGAGWDIDPSALISQVVERIPTVSDAVLVPGSGFRSANAQEKLQDLTNVPVISANMALKQTLFAAETPVVRR